MSEGGVSPLYEVNGAQPLKQVKIIILPIEFVHRDTGLQIVQRHILLHDIQQRAGRIIDSLRQLR
jgi:hypothetical protein